MKKILITGSLGLTGGEAVKFFKEKGWEVVGVDSNMRSYFFGVPIRKDGKSLSIDIRDEKAINNLFKEHGFDAIINCAAQPSHDWSQKDPLLDFDINARGTLILLEATRKYCPNAVFVHVSTDKVYGENMKYDLEELETRYEAKEIFTSAVCEKCNPLENYGCECKCHLDPKTYMRKYGGFDEKIGLDFAGNRSLFGCSKTAADIYVQEYGNYFGMKTVCFRCGCITGSRHAGAELHGFLAYLAKCIRDKIEYKIFGYKGKQVRDQIHAYDLVNAFWHFIQNPKVAAVYNMGGGPERSVSVLEAIDMLEKETGNEGNITYIDEPRKGDRIWDVHDVSKFRADYPDWDYKYSLKDIIKELSL